MAHPGSVENWSTIEESLELATHDVRVFISDVSFQIEEVETNLEFLQQNEKENEDSILEINEQINDLQNLTPFPTFFMEIEDEYNFFMDFDNHPVHFGSLLSF